MGEDAKQSEVQTPAPAVTEAPPADEKAVDPPSPVEKLADETKALAVVEIKTEPVEAQKSSGGSLDRDVALAKVETEKRISLIKAWEDNEKSKAENKASKTLSDIISWENTKKASVESKLKENEERLEKKKAEYAEKMKNKVAMIHKEAEEKRAMVEAKKGEELLKAEEMSAKYRATGHVPKKLLGCFGS